MFRSILLILSGNLSNAVIMMVRNLLVARLITVEEYGISSTFVLAMAIVDMMSALGLQQQMVQAKNGNDPYLQSALQGFQALRGVINGAILFLLAGPLARFFEMPEVTWAYQTIALVPMLQGFVHFDIHRMNRQMNYLPGVMTGILPPLVSLLLIWPLYKLFGDFRIMLFALLVQSSTLVLVSHLVAKRPYRLVLDRAIMGSSLRFGWPLLVNGALMFAVFNGERMIIGRELGMAALGLFSLGFSLALSPTLVMAKSGTSFFLPQLSAARGDAPAFRNVAMATFQAHLMMGNILVISLALLGGPFIHFILGAKYAAAVGLSTWLGILQGIRVAKGGSSTVALSQAHTGNAMIANIVRVMLLPIAWYIAVTGGDLVMVVWIGIVGEFVGFVLALGLALGRQKLPLRPLLAPLAISGLLFALAAVHAQAQHGAADWVPGLWTSLGLLALFGVALLTMTDLRSYISRRTLVKHDE